MTTRRSCTEVVPASCAAMPDAVTERAIAAMCANWGWHRAMPPRKREIPSHGLAVNRVVHPWCARVNLRPAPRAPTPGKDERKQHGWQPEYQLREAH